MDRDAIEVAGIDSLVPKEHLLRKIVQQWISTGFMK